MADIPGVGLFGKLPTRGDFVRAGLPGSFVTPWDVWLQQALADSQSRMGERWLPAWLEAPVWRFVLPPGACGAGGVLGLMLPSVDRVGRYFPLTLAAVFASGRSAPVPEAATDWLDRCETTGCAALEQDSTPEALLALIPPLSAVASARPADNAVWWTAGGPRVAAARMVLPGLPAPARFAAMLDDAMDAVPAGPVA